MFIIPLAIVLMKPGKRCQATSCLPRDRRAGIKQQAMRLQATGPYSITFLPLSFYLLLLTLSTSYSQPLPPFCSDSPELSIFSSWFSSVSTGFPESDHVSLPGPQWCRPHKVTEFAAIRWNLKPYPFAFPPPSFPLLHWQKHFTWFWANVTQLFSPPKITHV